MKIDIHAHILDRRYVDALARDLGLDAERTPSGQTLLRRNGYTFLWHREPMFDLDARLRAMDEQGVDMRVLSLSTPNVYEWRGARQVDMARSMNDLTAAIVRRHPDRFAGLASLPLDEVEASLLEIERATGELGLRGLAIGSNIAGVHSTTPASSPSGPASMRCACRYSNTPCSRRTRPGRSSRCPCASASCSTPRPPRRA